MSIEKTLAERGNRYGDFADHAKIAQAIQDDMRIGQGWARLDDVKRQALTVIADKIARILSGDPNYADNWHDIQGYAKLVEDRLPPVVKQSFTTEPASQIDDESPRQQAIAQNGNDGAAYSEIDRLRAAEAFNADLPAEHRRAQLWTPPQREPCQPRHRCLACGLDHAKHECQPAT